MSVPKMEDMPRRGLPMSIHEDALLTTALALFGDDMATAVDDDRMVVGYGKPTLVTSCKCSVRNKSYKMTVTLQFEAAEEKVDA